MKVSDSKIYMNLIKLFSQRKLEKGGILASIFLDIFLSAKRPSDYHTIKYDYLKIKGVFPCESYKNFHEWRETMIKYKILICMASFEELREETANHRGSMFRYGPAIKKYIESALLEKKSLIERIDTKADSEDLLLLEERMKERLELSATKEELADMKLEIEDIKENYISLMLHFLPPDNEVRREIVRKHKFDKETCNTELEKEAKDRARFILS